MAATDTEFIAAASETLRLYRLDHRIRIVVLADGSARCETDGIRVWPIRGGHYRHDQRDLARLEANAYAGPHRSVEEQMDAVAVEVARDVIREDLPLDRVSIPWGRHVVDFEVAP